VAGISAERALRELLANRQPRRTVVVAVIDGGVDTAHVDLIANLWSNAKETAGNGRDDDSNGYVDDVRGWNFIGGKDGRNVHHDTYEVARLHALCTNAGPAGETLPAALRSQCERISRDFMQDKQEAEATLTQIQMIGTALDRAVPMLKQALGTDSLTVERVSALRAASPQVEQAKQIYLQLAANGLTQDEVEEARKSYDSRVKYGLDPAYNPRPIVGDKYTDTSEKAYGDRDVMGPDAGHGTHVAGIIAAVRGNNQGMDGVAPGARIMTVRTVPDGDERDKDVANAIRYAVDNGAQIINMSFGKAYSPYKSAVDEAVKYADSRGVLMIHAAGNEGEDLEQSANFPNASYEGGGRAANWIEVGASSWKSADSLAAPFSNYGRQRVDVFAPGVDILSTVPGGGYEQESGTSMAAPVVSGLAALIMAYYPDLSAADVKRIILESATKRGQQMVIKPGTDGEKVPFGSLSATGGIVNAYAALQMAEQMSRAGR
jgi:subtilisin family serine protease